MTAILRCACGVEPSTKFTLENHIKKWNYIEPGKHSVVHLSKKEIAARDAARDAAREKSEREQRKRLEQSRRIKDIMAEENSVLADLYANPPPEEEDADAD